MRRTNPVIIRTFPEDRVKFRQMKQVKQNGSMESDQEAFNRLLKKLNADTTGAVFAVDTKNLLRGLRR